ncbi:thiamine ABC transporter substrate-binding protein [Nocardioides sp. GXZ039]|uniref:thiamine ABC transporter substrate-binding protein n=1 Tax=Nocardioides sp. GXZ039 TaxID=3136018 RepID=UPI0030F4889C
MRYAYGRRAGALAAAIVLTTTGCSLVGGDDDKNGGTDDASKGPKVVLVTHGSFSLPDDLIADFEADTGLTLDIRTSGDAGELTNKLVLTKDDPIGDVAFGVDNTFGSRALSEGVFEPGAVAWPEGVSQYALPGDEEHSLAPIDNGNVCVNIDDTWFTEHDVAPPTSLDDLADPTYRGLFVTPSAATSSPGLAFLLATIAEYGDDWPDYWKRLMDNDTSIASSWTDAYQVDFTQGGGDGDRPIVVSYDSSPAFTVAEGSDTSTTSALLDTCFLQVEYAGVLAGAENPEGATKVVEWLLSPAVQEALPENMYVFPTVDRIDLPAEWTAHVERPDAPLSLDPAEIDAERENWLREWNDITTR